MAQPTDGSAPRPGLPLNVPVQVEVEAGGRRHRVQVILASEWSPHLGAAPPDRVSFRVVLLSRPQAVAPAALQSDRVFLCVPSRPVSAPAIAEARAPYQAGSPPLPWAWSPQQAGAFAGGTVLAGRRSALDAAALFAGGEDAGSFLRRLAALVEAEDLRAQVAAVETYLERAAPKLTDDELYLDRLSLAEQLSAGTVLKDPALWPSVKALFDLFKNRYTQAYVRHHRAYRTEMAALHRELRNAEGKARALQLLDSIAELGAPVGGPALAAYQRAKGAAGPCPRPETDLTGLGADPVCPACRIPLNASPPSSEVQAALAAVNDALATQQRRLSAEAVRQVLAGEREARIDQLAQVLQVADTSALAQVMDEELAAFLRRLLGEATVELPLAPLLRQLRQRFPTIGEEDVDAFQAALEELLQREMEKARAAHPGKRIRLKPA